MEFIIIMSIFILNLTIFILTMRLDKKQDKLEKLEERLTKLEKDAVKITFTGEPQTTSKNKDFINPVKLKKRKPKKVEDWENEIDLGGHE